MQREVKAAMNTKGLKGRAVSDSSPREPPLIPLATWNTRKPNTQLSLFLLACVQDQQFCHSARYNRLTTVSATHVYTLCIKKRSISKEQAAIMHLKQLICGPKTYSVLWLIMALLLKCILCVIYEVYSMSVYVAPVLCGEEGWWWWNINRANLYWQYTKRPGEKTNQTWTSGPY